VQRLRALSSRGTEVLAAEDGVIRIAEFGNDGTIYFREYSPGAEKKGAPQRELKNK
jgi:hypothetical protein